MRRPAGAIAKAASGDLVPAPGTVAGAVLPAVAWPAAHLDVRLTKRRSPHSPRPPSRLHSGARSRRLRRGSPSRSPRARRSPGLSWKRRRWMTRRSKTRSSRRNSRRRRPCAAPAPAASGSRRPSWLQNAVEMLIRRANGGIAGVGGGIMVVVHQCTFTVEFVGPKTIKNINPQI